MKKTITFLAVALVVVGAYASPLQFSDATIQTNGAVQATQTPDSDAYVSGWVDTVFVDITAGNSDTNTITLFTLGDTGGGASRTILTLSNVSADGVYPVRDLVTGVTGSDISNEPARIFLQQDQLRMTAIASGADTNATAATMDVYVITTDSP